jgi:cation diffusion facilitator CzcD-associated flavoprotein CzcO
MEEPSKVSNADLQHARERYRIERDKRMKRSQPGTPEYDLGANISRYLEDPFTKPTPRAAVTDEVEVVCVGAGFAGLLVCANMRKAGFTRVRLIDSAGDVGGVWYWNRYPEAKCDVDSLVYMPLLEETGYIPTMKYAAAPEIGEHARRIARHYELYEHALFHTSVTAVVWDENLNWWHVRTDRGDSVLAQFVVLALGPLSKVKLAGIPGVDSFQGKSFHTSRWDYEYTGGTPTDNKLDRLKDKIVGFIGTGATGLQCVAPLAESAKQLFVFQRTPSTVGPRNNGPIDADKVARLPSGWQARRQDNFTAINFGLPVEEDLVQDGWTDLYRDLLASPSYSGLSDKAKALEMERIDFKKMERIRTRIDAIVTNPDVAAKLKPQYSYLCKRPGWHDEYLPAFNRPNVTLIDTDGAGVEAITPRGVMVGSKEYPLDCLIYGTGFETETLPNGRIGIDVIGRGGVTLADKWANGVTTLHGLTIAGFPNFFVIPAHSGQAVLTTNVVHMSGKYAEHIAYIAMEVRDKGAEAFELTAGAEADWVRTILERRIDSTEFLKACTPGRNNNEGQVEARPVQNTLFGGSAPEFFVLLQDWRSTGRLSGFALYGNKRPVREKAMATESTSRS